MWRYNNMFLGLYDNEEDNLVRLEQNIVTMVYTSFGYNILDELIIKREYTTKYGMRILLRSKAEHFFIYLTCTSDSFYNVRFDLIHSTNAGDLIDRVTDANCKTVLDVIQSALEKTYDTVREPLLVVLIRRIKHAFRKRKPKDANIS